MRPDIGVTGASCGTLAFAALPDQPSPAGMVSRAAPAALRRGRPAGADRARRCADRHGSRMRAEPPRRRRPSRSVSTGLRGRPPPGTPPPAPARAPAGRPPKQHRPPRRHTTIRRCPATQNAGPAKNQHTRPGSCVQPNPRPQPGPESPSPVSPQMAGTRDAYRAGTGTVKPCCLPGPRRQARTVRGVPPPVPLITSRRLAQPTRDSWDGCSTASTIPGATAPWTRWQPRSPLMPAVTGSPSPPAPG